MAPSKRIKTDNLGSRLIKGSAWMVAMRWSSRIMGLASMVVVARLLSPADFGIYAVATAFIGLMDAFTDIGTDIAIIRHPAPERRHYDTAWTFKIILHSVSALSIALAAPFAARLYGDQRYVDVMHLLALAMLVNGFINIGVADFRRNLEFSKDFKYNVITQAAGVLTTLGLAFLLRSYWALVFGNLARSLAALALSYAMHDHRPRLTLSARHEMFGFSFWVMVRSMAHFLVSSGDRLVLGAFFSASITGYYAIANSLATMAVFELLNPIGRALLPGIAAKQGDREWERRNLRKIFGGTATVAAAAGVGLASVATPAITLIYGERFAEAGPMLVIMAFVATIGGFNQPVGQYLTVLGRVRELALILLLEGIAAMVATYGLASMGSGIQGVLYARLGVAMLVFVRLFYLVRLGGALQWRDIAAAWVRPGLAGLAMFVVLAWLQREIAMPGALAFAVGIFVGAATYASVLYLAWRVMGRPPGIEEEIMARLSARLGVGRARNS